MLQKLRKFSSTVAAKILLAVVILPFVMWGMGDIFRQGNRNVIATLNNEKISVKEFTDYINNLNLSFEETIKKNPDYLLEELNNFISKKIILLETAYFGIDISENALAQIIKSQKNFTNDGSFSRTKYEKFLIESNLNTLQFESNVKQQEQLKLFFEFISGGITSPDFLVKKIYNQKNQGRDIEVIDLNKIYIKNLKLTDKKISEYFENNLDKFKDNYKSIKYSEINPESLLKQSEYNNLFFQKLDKIEDLIAADFTIDDIAKKFNLKVKDSNFFNKNGKNTDGNKEVNFDKKLLLGIFQISQKNNPTLLSYKDNYILVQISSEKSGQPDVNSGNIKKNISHILKKEFFLNQNIKLVKKINKNEFSKYDFDRLVQENNIEKKIIKLNNLNDDQLSENVMKEIYKLPLNKIGLITTDNFDENLLVYTIKIHNKTINKYDKNYKDYLYDSNMKIIRNIYSSYDRHVNEKYNLDINYQTLENIKNYYK